MKLHICLLLLFIPLALLSLQNSQSDSATALALFTQTEDRLLSADSVYLVYSIQANGYIEAGLEGHLTWKPEKQANLAASGTFTGQDVDLSFHSDGSAMQGVNGEVNAVADTPPGLNDSMIIGFMRMGLLHNLAVMTTKGLPDKTDGTVRDWVQVSNFSSAEQDSTRSLSFNVTVDGKPVAEAVLYLDVQTLLPVKRTQTVHFDGGDMQVVEKYPELKVYE